MKRSVWAGCYLLMITSIVNAQPKNINLKGYLAVEGGESFTYNIVFTDSAGILSGYSYTYLEEQREVKAAITGEIDREKKTLSFKESNIIYNHGFESKAIMCLINARLKYALKDNVYILSGPINSRDATNADCGSGTISFMESEALKSLFATAEKKDTVVPVKKEVTERRPSPYRPARPVVVQDIDAGKSAAVSTPDEITKGVEKVYEWRTDTVQVEIWDGGNVDGDIVSLKYNDKVILDHYTLTSRKKKIFIPLSGKEIDVLTVVAHNEGNEPPNTANIILTDGSKQYNIIAYNSIGQEAVVKIRKIK